MIELFHKDGEKLTFSISFPIAWNFDSDATDGFGGDPVHNPATIHILAESCGDFELAGKVDLQEVIDDFIDGLVTQSGAIEKSHVYSATALRDMLTLCANKINSKLP